jgi:(E)-4-hydroxy-3-methylbut-2-enyl-diphosphate synthase
MKSIKRRKSKIIKIGHVCIGGEYPVAIQSMTKTHTKDIEKTSRQIQELELSGCEIIRLSVKDMEDARAIGKIKSVCKLPLVADIHYDFHLGLVAIDNGIDKVRLNPGNIYKRDQIREIAQAAKMAHIPIRVGVNSGSLRNPKSQVLPPKRDPKSQADKMVKSVLDYVRILEKFGFYDIVVSLKASNIPDTIQAYRKMACLCDYPLHLGMTATGLASEGIIKSTICLGVLLSEGIGDTIRISLTDTPQEEVRVAKSILEAMGLRHFGPEVISCPTCGRCEVDLIKIVRGLEGTLSSAPVPQRSSRTGKLVNWETGKPMKIAVMGCMVNGPGEAKEADLGIAFGKKEGLLFRRGKPIRKVFFGDCIDILVREMQKIN